MAIRPEDLPSDPAALAEMVLAFEGENEDLRAQIATLKGLIFGARSERSAIICAEQLVFDLERTADAQRPANDDEPESGAARTKRRKPRRNIGSLPAHLPRCEQVIEPASTLCPCCSGQMHRIGEETSEALDRVPAWLRVLRTIRPKYACRSLRGSDRPGQGAGAARRGRHGDDGADRSHCYGQVRLAVDALSSGADPWAGHGVVVDRQTLARWMGSAAWMAKGLYDLQGGWRSHASILTAAVLRRDADAGARSGTRAHQGLSVLGACDGRSPLEGSAGRRRSPMCSRAAAARRRS